MLTDGILIQTKVAHAGMAVREAFEECLRARLQAMPFADERSRIVGRLTLKYIITRSIVPDYVAELAHVLGPGMSSLKEMEARLKTVFELPVDDFVQEPHASIASDSELMKALAVMEHHDTSYLFVIDDGIYKGTLTIPGIAKWMMRFDEGVE